MKIEPFKTITLLDPVQFGDIVVGLVLVLQCLPIRKNTYYCTNFPETKFSSGF